MARVDTCTVPSKPGQVLTFYNVTMAVGTNAPNRRDDAFMVQYMLKRVYERPAYKNFTLTPQQGTMSVDGVCGPITVRWIRHFQLDVRNVVGGPIFVDGRIDYADKGYGSISGTQYTIFYLNDAFEAHYKEIFDNMPTHPDVPVEVRSALLLSMA